MLLVQESGLDSKSHRYHVRPQSQEGHDHVAQSLLLKRSGEGCDSFLQKASKVPCEDGKFFELQLQSLETPGQIPDQWEMMSSGSGAASSSRQKRPQRSVIHASQAWRQHNVMGKPEAQGCPWCSMATGTQPQPLTSVAYISSQAVQEKQELNSKSPCSMDILAP